MEVFFTEAYFELFRDKSFELHISTSENNNFLPHYHSNIEIIYVIEGEIVVTISGQSRRLKAGDIAVSNSYDTHSYVTPEHSVIKVLIIPLELAGSFSRMSEGQTFASPFLCDPSFSSDIYDALCKLERINSDNSLAAKGYLYVILGTLADGISMAPCSKDTSAVGPIRNMLVYLDLNFRDPIQITDLAKKFGYNKDYLSRVFNSTLNCGFKYYLNLLRARNAANLILNSDMSISDIAYESGFTSQRTFNRSFKELYHVTPMEFKQMSRIERDKLYKE